MRGIETPVRNVRRRIFKEIAKFGYEQKNLQDLEDLPYEIVPGEVAKYRDSIYQRTSDRRRKIEACNGNVFKSSG